MKVKLTEGQIQRLKPIFENIDDKYRKEVKFRFSFDKGVYPYEINDIEDVKATVLFDINIEHKRWGIAGISVFGIQGPSNIKTIIEYYSSLDPNNDETATEEIAIKLDWENAISLNEESGSGYFTIGDEIEVVLSGNKKTGYFAKEINLDVFS